MLSDDAVIRWIAGDEPLLHRPVQAVMEHCVDAPDVGATEAWILLLLRFTYPAVFFEVVVQHFGWCGLSACSA